MRSNLYSLTICLLVCASNSGSSTHKPVDVPPQITLQTGLLEGTRFGGAQNDAAFLGVPYAAPPVRELRWRPPQPPNSWNGLRNATQFGAACPQLRANWFPYIGWNEDCLYLNVWTPEFSRTAKLPVIVYFHGGSNTQGYSQMTSLGPALSRYGVVVVSANYRLGPFGFLAHPALTAESVHHSSGNYGLLDQVQALRWVHENISHFGGDPGQVTVMGQSAGAVDICLLMASPLVNRSFQRAILESGECQSTLNKDIRIPIPYNAITGTGEEAGERLANDLGVADTPDIVKKLREISAEEILKAWSHDRQLHFDAIVDGWVVPKQPAKIFAEGEQMHVPVLVGSNADEATVFGHNTIQTVAEYKDYLRQDAGKYSDQEFHVYPATSDAEVPALYLQLQNDSFAYGAKSLAQSVTRSGQIAYLYYFTYADAGKRAPLGAHHGEELFFLSASFPPDWQPNSDDQKFGELIRSYWTQFAKTENPNTRNSPRWAAYNEWPNRWFELGHNVGVQPIPARLQSLERIIEQTIAGTGTR